MTDFDLISIAEMFNHNPWIICLAIFLFTFVLEDVATVSAALLASYGYVPAQAAFICLAAGIILGDFGLYGLGYLASRYEWAKRVMMNKKVQLANDWLGERKFLGVVTARFIPGARLPTYTAMGFFRFPFMIFFSAVLLASVAWTIILFTSIYFIGEIFVEELHQWKWHVAVIMIIAIVFLPRIIQKLFRKRVSL